MAEQVIARPSTIDELAQAQQRKAAREEVKNVLDLAFEAECTFAPQISERSRAAAERVRYGKGSVMDLTQVGITCTSTWRINNYQD